MAQQLEFIDFRSSSLSDHGDCARRSAAKLLKDQIGQGYGLKGTVQGAGTAIGTVLHSLMEELFRIKLQMGDATVDDVSTAMERTWPKFLKEIEPGVLWDKKGPTYHEDNAREQLHNMAVAFLPIVALTSPQDIELELTHLISPLGTQAIPVKLSGHLDLRDSRYLIHDHKTGKSFPSAHIQMGCYALLCEYNDMEVNGLVVNFVPRKGMKSQHEVVCRSVMLPLEECKAEAFSALKQFQRHYMDYLETGDKASFPANPRSQLCGRRYCDALGTGWCGVGNTLDEED